MWFSGCMRCIYYLWIKLFQLFLFLAKKLAVLGLLDCQIQYLSGSSFVSVSLSLLWSDCLDVFHIVFCQILGLVSVTTVLSCQVVRVSKVALNVSQCSSEKNSCSLSLNLHEIWS